MTKQVYKQCLSYNDGLADRVFDIFDLRNGQVNISRVKTKKVNAWKIHRKQTDCFHIVDGVFKFGIGKPTDTGGVNIEFVVLSANGNVFLEVPPGLWHGYQMISSEGTILYHLSDKHDPNDEETAKPGSFGEVWEDEG